MRRTELLQEVRKMRFEEAYGGWQERRLTQEEVARMLGVCERTFRRYVDRYEEEGLDGLVDKRLGQVSARRAPVDEVMRTEALYRERYEGWNVKHFHSFYRREHGGRHSYTWVKNTLQRAGLVAKAPGRGKHRRRRERAPLVGMMLHQSLPSRKRGTVRPMSGWRVGIGTSSLPWMMRLRSTTRCSSSRRRGRYRAFGGWGRSSRGGGWRRACTPTRVESAHYLSTIQFVKYQLRCVTLCGHEAVLLL